MAVFVARTGLEVESALRRHARQELRRGPNRSACEDIERAIVAEAAGVLEKITHPDGCAVIRQLRNPAANVIVE